jgi:hypothetical protein
MNLSCVPIILSLASALAGLEVEGGLWRMGGGVSGIGVLARYPAPGPGLVAVTRTTTSGTAGETPPVTVFKVVDPTGSTVACGELDDGTARMSLPVPPGPAGIWRFSVQGGRNGDRIILTLPATQSWGLRGEMALAPAVLANGLAGWLWVPTGTGAVLMEAIGGGVVELSHADGSPLPGVAEGTRRLWRWNALPIGSAIRVRVSGGAKALAVDGMPGLLCPDASAAADLRGGTSEEYGRMVMGPLQARARRWMLAAVKRDLDPRLVFPAQVPEGIANPIAALQLYGAYAPLSGLRAACAAQVTDPSASTFGSLGGASDMTLNGPAISTFEALGLAAAVTAGAELNPAHGNAALVTRATLLAFYHLTRLQGDDLIREGDIARSGYPMTHAFFVYPGSLAGPYALLRPHLDAEAQAIWRDGLIAVGDRMADHRGYQTNQMWHVTLAHLMAYRATGEPRFRRWFERQVRELLDRPTVSRNKFGQHPAGWFLEEYGPDGNYDAISGTCLVEAWRDYRDLPDADPVVLALLHAGIARNLAFSACHWLPQPDGSVFGPTAMMSRKVFSFADQGWPGTRLAREVFALAAARWQLAKMPVDGIGAAVLMPHLVNNEAWARRALRELLPLGDAKYLTASRGIPAAWTHEAERAARLPVTLSAVIPCRTESGRWEVPGQVAWKRDGLYGLVFWGAPGSPPLPANCRIGGAPSALWTEATGSILLSQHNTHFEGGTLANNGVATTDDLTHSCISGRYADGLWWSGREVADLVTEGGDGGFRIAGRATAGPRALVTWGYGFVDGGLEMTAGVDLAGLDAPFLNLPLLMAVPGADVVEDGPAAVVFRAGTGTVGISWSGGAAGTITDPLATGIASVISPPVRCLRIPMLRDGDTWTQRVRFSPRR